MRKRVEEAKERLRAEGFIGEAGMGEMGIDWEENTRVEGEGEEIKGDEEQVDEESLDR